MGYQGGRRYGGDTYGDRDRYGAQDRANRYRGAAYRDQDDRGYNYGPPASHGTRDPRRESVGHDDDRGFFDRAGDEVRSWFGDEDAERRREYDERRDDHRDEPRRAYGDRSRGTGYAPYSGYGSLGYDVAPDYGARDRAGHHDSNYHSWRQDRINELDRDYADYQRENRDRFHQEFTGWRTRRGEQRQALQQVREHMDVVGSDGEHVGKVDKLRGDRIILTKSDTDAGGVHHSIPSSWIKSVDAQKVTLEKTADQAQHAWRTEREQQALFGKGDGDDSSFDARQNAISGTRYR